MNANIRKKEKNVCKHKHLVFLGKQEILNADGFLALFNCMDCRSTITLKMHMSPVKRRKAS